MNHVARVAFIHAQCVCALAEIEAMKAANACQASDMQPVYGYQDFMAVQDKYIIGHNAVIDYLRS